jgi:hypothetical protein
MLAQNDSCGELGRAWPHFPRKTSDVANASGQFGTGANLPEPDLVPWGGRNDVVAFATGTWGDVCILDQQGSIYCAGTGYSIVA